MYHYIREAKSLLSKYIYIYCEEQVAQVAMHFAGYFLACRSKSKTLFLDHPCRSIPFVIRVHNNYFNFFAWKRFWQVVSAQQVGQSVNMYSNFGFAQKFKPRIIKSRPYEISLADFCTSESLTISFFQSNEGWFLEVSRDFRSPKV